MKALICTNENAEIVSVHISTNENALNEKMRSEYEAELDSVDAEGYDLNSVDYDFNERDSAYIKASENYQYLWVIKDCVEV